jgi:hypothetical protein
MVEGGLNNDKLHQRCYVFDVKVFEDLPEVPERIVIDCTFVEKYKFVLFCCTE